jgi:hypothetical protein
LPARDNWPDGYCHNQRPSGTLISHAFSILLLSVTSTLSTTEAISALIKTMADAALRALPVATTGVAPLFDAGQLPAAATAVLLPAITGTANEEDCAAVQASAKALTQRIFAA